MTTLPSITPDHVRHIPELADRVVTAVGTSIVGQREPLRQLLIGILCGGHCLLEGVPGVAKTSLVKAVSEAVGLSFGRIQFTPDLMPADITGTDVLDDDRVDGSRRPRFLPGPIFAHLLLADEINRSPPKTQAALLEAMQEGQVTVGGHFHPLPRPFITLATQNPIDHEGTYPLPEGQLDRFLLMIRIDYPSRDEELDVVRLTTGEPQPATPAIISRDDLLTMMHVVRAIPISDSVLRFGVDLIRRTRPQDSTAPAWVRRLVAWGAGPRASQALVLAGKAAAALDGRPCVEIRDLRAFAAAVLRHRIIPSFEAEAEGLTSDVVVDRLLDD